MITGLAHTAVCVPDVEAAVAWYESVLGLSVLSPPYLMEGPQIEEDMGELLPPSPPSPPSSAAVAVKAAILGFEDSDHVLEVIEYPRSPGRPRPPEASVIDTGFTHIGLVCDDIEATRRDLEAKGVRFLTSGIARVARLRTTWFTDPYGLVYILLEKGMRDRPYWRQY